MKDLSVLLLVLPLSESDAHEGPAGMWPWISHLEEFLKTDPLKVPKGLRIKLKISTLLPGLHV